MRPRLLSILLLGIASAACGNPSRESDIERLGPEEAGFSPSPTHRPGQPCVLCHSETGGAEPTFSLGGTLFHVPTPEPNELPSLVLAADYTVRIVDSEGESIQMKSNECGNFYILKDSFDPAFPLRADVRDADGNPVAEMKSRIGRDGSCGSCHLEQRSPYSAGVIRVSTEAPSDPPSSCPTPRFAQP